MVAAAVAISSETLSRLAQLGAATLHEAQGQKGALSPAIKPIDPAMVLVGPALTIDARPGDNLVIHYALTKAKRGDVLVVDAKGFLEAGAWGDILTLAAQEIGIAGLVIDGSVRDIEAIIAMGFPCFARGTAIHGTNKHQPGSVNTAVVCGGVRIDAGDIIVGDRDGLVAIPSRSVDDVLKAAGRRADTEERYRGHLRNGKTTVDILNLSEILQKLGMN